MPFREQRGRFLVTTDQSSPEATASKTNWQSRPSSAVTASTPGSEHRVKRGRFTVSTCVPCPQPRTVHSGDAPRVFTSSHADSSAVFFCRSDIQNAAMGSSGGDRDISPFACCSKDQLMSDKVSDSSGWDCSSKASDSSFTMANKCRKVRFSEPGYDAIAAPERTGSTSPKAALKACIKNSSSASSINSSHHAYLFSPTGSEPQPITRSYCRGRFQVREAVLVCNIPRSMSAPEQSSSLQDMLYATASSRGSRNSSFSSTASATVPSETQHSLESSSSDDYHQHMLAVQRQQHSALAQVVAVAAAAAADSYWAVASAATIGEAHGLGSTMSDDLVAFNAAGSSGTAAATAAGGKATRQRYGPKRCHSVSYFRRGRFLVQTTYT